MNNKIKEFNEYIRDNFKNCWDVPGLAICIFDDNKIIYKKAFGYANTKTKRKLKVSDKFCIASCTKSIVCLAISLAIKNKEIPDIWKMTIGDVYSDTIDCKNYANVPVTYLACHTSGITDWFNNCPKKRLVLKKYEDMEGIESRKKVTKIILSQPPHYNPGSKYEYSNIAYGILGGIVEKYTGESYNNIIEKYIFEPLKIKADNDVYHLGDGYAEGHVNYMAMGFRDGEFTPLGKNEYVNPAFDHPSGVMYLSISDSAKYLQEYLKASKNNSSIMTKSIYKNQIKEIMNKYGLGWKIIKTDEHIYHGGAFFYATTRFAIYPKKSLGIVININTYESPLFNIINDKFYKLFVN
jgi:D-alanyl-D-alanine carboxypeptidase